MARTASQAAAQLKAAKASAAKRRKAAKKAPAKALHKTASERKASIEDRKITKVMHRNYVRTGSEGSVAKVTKQVKKNKKLTPAQRAARVRKAAGLKKKK